jgi:hypothetical protein
LNKPRNFCGKLNDTKRLILPIPAAYSCAGSPQNVDLFSLSHSQITEKRFSIRGVPQRQQSDLLSLIGHCLSELQ